MGRGSIYHWYGVDIPWVECRYTMGRGVDISLVGGRYTMGRGRYTMGGGSIYNGLGVNIPWVGDSIFSWLGWSIYHGERVDIP